jgi:hypothetical protein
MTFVSDDGKCPVEMKDCCCEEGKHDSQWPDCMVVTKPLPNADKTPAPQIPHANDKWVLLPAALADFPPAVGVEILPVLCQHFPPVIPDPLYLTQRRLLI